MVMADSGEDAIVFCEKCNYAANLEKAEIVKPAAEDLQQKEQPVMKVLKHRMCVR